MPEPAEEMPTAALLDGRYQLGECIGQGGMARVFRAEDLQLGRTVAIKMVRDDLDAPAPERARMEVGLLASLNHPSLVTLFDASIEPGRPEYLVMELVEGVSLAEELEGGALDPAEVRALASDLASGLHVVHAAGIVHRDVKPSNVLLAPTALPGRRYRAKLADFGVAYLVDATRLTSPGFIIGTAAYLAPEQVRGEPAGPAADIYALGLMLLESLTGERAFPHASGIGAMMTRLIEEPAIPDWLGPEWAELLRGMTATDPATRPAALEVLHTVDDLPTQVGTAPVRVASPGEAQPPVPTMPLPLPSVAAAVDTQQATGNHPVGPTTADAAHAVPRRGRRARRAAVILPLAAAVALLFIQVGMWLGGLQLQSGVAPLVDSTPAPSPTIVEQAVTEDEVEPVVPVSDVRSNRHAAPERPGKDTEKAARDAEKQADKAAREQEKAAEAAAQEAEKRAAAEQRAAEKAARDAEKGGPGGPGKKKP